MMSEYIYIFKYTVFGTSLLDTIDFINHGPEIATQTFVFFCSRDISLKFIIELNHIFISVNGKRFSEPVKQLLYILFMCRNLNKKRVDIAKEERTNRETIDQQQKLI